MMDMKYMKSMGDMKGRDRSDTSPVKRSPTLVPDNKSYAPAYDAKYMTGIESAMTRVGTSIKSK